MAKQPKATDKLLPRLTGLFFDRPRLTAILFLIITSFGIISYTTLLRREGFPSVNIPIAIVTGTYPSTDAAVIDQQLGKPLSDIALKQPGVTSVQTKSAPYFVSVTVQYTAKTDARAATKQLEQAVANSKLLPANVKLAYNVPYFGATGGDADKIDMTISFYSKDGSVSTEVLARKAAAAVEFLNAERVTNVEAFFLKDPYRTATDPLTGHPRLIQNNFDRFGVRENGKTGFYNSVIIGVSAKRGFDVIKLDNDVRAAVDKLNARDPSGQYRAQVSASFAPSIRDNLSELQRVLLEGLAAVLLIGWLIIALRASLITIISMVTVIAITLGFIYLIGYTLNVITLFALILGLSLVVDDTIIMTEAIDAARRRLKQPREIVMEASRKISRAMVAATLTAMLSFMPLAFVGGVLGSFIRAIPVTIISALLISLFVALIFIPLFARFLLLGNKQLRKDGVREVAAGFEAAVAGLIARPMLWAKGSSRKLAGVGLAALAVAVAFIFGGLFIAKDVVFNIFPPTKDTNALLLNIKFKPGTTITQAQDVTRQAEKIAAEVLGDNFVESSLFATGNPQQAIQRIEITSYTKRAATSHDFVKQLQDRYNREFTQANVSVSQEDVGPPQASFLVQVDASDRAKALQLANDIAAYMKSAELKRINGTAARFIFPSVSDPDLYYRMNDKPILTVSSGFDGNDTSTLTTLAKNAISQEFNARKVASYGLPKDTISFNLGQESENQDSFKTLALAFPAVLAVIYVLLAVQFRSLLQPLLIFMALPFSLFGIMLGLRLTNNPISFFALLGFFALIGLSIKNTILLTDSANQARRAGAGPVDAAVAALQERFRPLIATSLTAVVSLIPLAITSPFWQGLAVVLIFGLLSSTLLVITVFPYFYLGGEFLRRQTRRAFRKLLTKVPGGNF